MREKDENSEMFNTHTHTPIVRQCVLQNEWANWDICNTLVKSYNGLIL